MNETSLTILAAGAAFLMLILIKAGLNAEKRAAVRTTVVLVLAWAIAAESGTSVSMIASWTVGTMFVLSIVNLTVVWAVALRAQPVLNERPNSLIDQINVGFAAVFGLLLVARGPFREAAINAVMIFAAALVLAVKRN